MYQVCVVLIRAYQYRKLIAQYVAVVLEPSQYQYIYGSMEVVSFNL